MKIALLTSEFPPFRGGIATYSLELARAAAAAGHDVTVLAPDFGEAWSEQSAAEPFRIIRFPGGSASIRGLPRRIALTRSLLAGERFDIVHAADWPFFLALRLANRRGARAILTVHGSEILYMRDLHRRAMLSATRFWQPGWAEWVANSGHTADLLAATFPVPRDAIRAVPLGVSADWIAGRVPRASARAQFGLGDAEVVIISLGRLVARKGHLDLADALDMLPAATARHVIWWVIGSDTDRAYSDAVRARASKLGVRAEILGKRPLVEVQARLSAADVFCLPGYRDAAGLVEGFGLAFLEAAAYGVPAVATRSGGIAEAVLDGETGLLVSERDVPGLSHALSEVIENAALRADLGARAVAHAARSTWSSVMTATYG